MMHYFYVYKVNRNNTPHDPCTVLLFATLNPSGAYNYFRAHSYTRYLEVVKRDDILRHHSDWEKLRAYK